MASKRPHLTLLFAGGTMLEPKVRRGLIVEQASDVKPWLSSVAEMDIVASTTGVFVTAGVEPVSWPDWVTIAQTIHDQYADSDGFVIFHQASTMVPAALALHLMLSNLTKPVVLVTSPWLSPGEQTAGLSFPDFPVLNQVGARATFINALQVALSNVAGVMIVAGHQVLSGANPHAPPLGKIDFGVRMLGKQQPRLTRSTVDLKLNYRTNVAIIEYVPGIAVEHALRGLEDVAGVFVACHHGGSIPQSVLTAIKKKTTAPIAVYGLAGQVPTGVIMLSGGRSSALVKFFWALGQTKKYSALQKLIS